MERDRRAGLANMRQEWPAGVVVSARWMAACPDLKGFCRRAVR
jgi:hypothetical protein